MKKYFYKTIFLVSAVALLITIAPPVKASTIEDLQAEIQMLQQSLNTMLQSNTTTPVPLVTKVTCNPSNSIDQGLLTAKFNSSGSLIGWECTMGTHMNCTAGPDGIWKECDFPPDLMVWPPRVPQSALDNPRLYAPSSTAFNNSSNFSSNQVAFNPVIKNSPTGTSVVKTPLPKNSLPIVAIQYGQKNSEVLSLQKFLNTHGFTITSEGLGSPGNETGFFGELTKKALSSFQIAHGLLKSSLSAGIYGPWTDSLINTKYGGLFK